ncbi:riboflavin kinase/FMN adenylyltransferase [Alteribacillus persepolensis]|uniref:FAD synthase n=1 Tax=Alteribacillus persepolensis TaxID=568899 RepID=A0A1G8KB24_9BACI|nr:FAD synthetase [Alteribacillus persepolensis]SDI40645.1 riboflavin kinase/FMN adenylyltransferase [Alteribacillus persepolensis]
MNVYSDHQLSLPHSVVSIGAFDGLHLGHQTLINKAASRAKTLGVPSVVYTFNPPPRSFFQQTQVLTSVEEKVELIKRLGIDYVVVADFNKEYASREAIAFVHELQALSPKEVWVGPNFQFGKGKQGTTEFLSHYFHVNLHPLVRCQQGKIISSTRIRLLLQKNQIEHARKLLAHPQMTP